MKKKLREIAVVLRCQMEREGCDSPERPIMWERKWSPVWHEIGLDALDQDTGFVIPDRLNTVRLFDDPWKYAVRPGDIVMCFQGAPARIGECGIIIDNIAAIPGRSLCIIRTEMRDPFWLFSQLQEPDIIKDLQPDIKRGKALVSLEKIRDLRIEEPYGNEERTVRKIFEEIQEDYRESRSRLKTKRELIKSVLHGKAREFGI